MTAATVVGERVHQLMWRNRIPQTTLASHLGITQSTLSRKLRGDRPWTLDELLATAAYLEVPVTDLLPVEATAAAGPYPSGPGGKVARSDGAQSIDLTTEGQPDEGRDFRYATASVSPVRPMKDAA